METHTTIEKYIDRDLSWLSFNYRVLQEAGDPETPLFERIKFLAIYSSNLDEFFKVRVAHLKNVVQVKKKKRKKLGLASKKVLRAILEEVERQQDEFGSIFRNEILPALEAQKIFLLQKMPEDLTQRKFIENLFLNEIRPNLHPELLMKNKITHFLRDNALYLVVSLTRKDKTPFQASENGQADREKPRKRVRYALVQIPVHYFPRFVRIPTLDSSHSIMFLDDIIRYNIGKVFPAFDINACYSVKMSRDADLLIEDEFDGDLVEKIRKSLSHRQVGEPARFLYDRDMPTEMLKYLKKTFNLGVGDIVPGGKYHNFSDLFGFPNPVGPDLEQEKLPPLPAPELDAFPSMLQAIKERERILHFPYHTYDYVLRFLNEASMDPNVTIIQATQYRVASDSAIVQALINAAQNGKEVTVFVEIKARFDEATNLKSADAMRQAGVRVIYSMPGLKVHAKVAMITRKEGEGVEKYAFLSTGNFNEKTARIYADHGFFTNDQRICNELSHVFRFLAEKLTPPVFNHLLVAQFNMRSDFLSKIDREIEHAQAGEKAYVLVKCNNLEDAEMIDKLYEASAAGVKIELIVRGICRLKPGVAGLSEHIEVKRIVGRFLEHARVFIFHNQGANEMYMGSADWMERNLSRRVEVVFPIYNETLKREVAHLLHLQLTDNCKAVVLDQYLANVRVQAGEDQLVCAQEDTYALLSQGKLGTFKQPMSKWLEE